MAIRHPAILQALDTDDVVVLRAAAAQINAPDPFDALQIIDCDPPGIAHLAGNMANAKSPFRQASYDLAAALELATRDWEGEAKERFLVEAAEVQRDHLQAATYVENTANAGLTMERPLDDYAQTAARNTVTTAQLVHGECVLLLSGDTSPDVIERINDACLAILRGIAELADSIHNIASQLNDLTQPVRQ